LNNTSYQSLYLLLCGLWNQISRRRRTQLVGLAILATTCAVADVISLGAIVPLLTALAMPEALVNNSAVMSVSGWLGIAGLQDLTAALAIAFALLAVCAGLLRLLHLRVGTQLAYSIGADVGGDLFSRVLMQPYQVHLSRNSSQVISDVTQNAACVVTIVMAMIAIGNAGLLLITIVGALIFLSPVVAIGAVLSFGAAYGLVMVYFRRKIFSYGKVVTEEHARLLRAIQEGVGGIRDILLDGSQGVFVQVFKAADRSYRKAHGGLAYIGGAPRLVLESLGIAVIAILTAWLSMRGESLLSILPVLGAFALGAQRLLPALQQAYMAWTAAIGSQAAASRVLDVLADKSLDGKNANEVRSLSWAKRISLQQVGFRYFDKDDWVLRNLDIAIEKGERIGIVGMTGSGKSTLLDILMGLLPPSEGKVFVDDMELHDDLRAAWRKSIAHVPQAIYLSDASLAENIAFGVPKSSIDLVHIKKCLEYARLTDFVMTLPDGLDTRVGERGVRLSGGQRQRIGIARALYKMASLLILDEATSALDNDTERDVMEAIEDFGADITIIIVAHRITTLSGCSRIFEIQSGRLMLYKSYEEYLVTQGNNWKM
jgi:ABC-type multidrug transport system fused ATPase/permease subunit